MYACADIKLYMAVYSPHGSLLSSSQLQCICISNLLNDLRRLKVHILFRSTLSLNMVKMLCFTRTHTHVYCIIKLTYRRASSSWPALSSWLSARSPTDKSVGDFTKRLFGHKRTTRMWNMSCFQQDRGHVKFLRPLILVTTLCARAVFCASCSLKLWPM